MELSKDGIVCCTIWYVNVTMTKGLVKKADRFTPKLLITYRLDLLVVILVLSTYVLIECL